MEETKKPKDEELDDLINSTLEDFEELERSGHFNSTNTASEKNPIDFNKIVEKTMEKLSENMKSGQSQQQNPPPNPDTSANEDDLLEQMLNEFDNNTGYQGLVQGMMQQLLSKDVLYEPMKEMRDKYPAWLRENQSKLPQAEFEKYVVQYNHIEEILFVYEKEGDKDFDKILKLMREMQECGHVPTEIVRQLAPDVEFDAHGQPVIPGMESFGNLNNIDPQCTIL